MAGLFTGEDIGMVLSSESSTFTGSFASDFGGEAKGNIGAVKSLNTAPTPASVAGFVYLDSNDNGLMESGEPGIPGVTVTLTGTNYLGQSVNLTTTTNSAGAYSFTTLAPGTYSLTETPPTGYLDGINTVGSQGGTVGDDQFTNVVLAAGQNGMDNDFAELLPASIAGNVYNDANDNGDV